MTAINAKATKAGASPRAAQVWDQANWSHIEATVKRLQVRIAKATREGRWGKVKALQRLLTRSHGGKMLAVKRVQKIAARERRVLTAKSGQLRRPNGREWCRFNIVVITRCLCGASTSPRVTVRSVRWVFPACVAGRCKPYGSSPWNPWLRHWRTRTPMDFGPNARLPTPSLSASSHWPSALRQCGFWKATFGVVSTTSVTPGF